MGGMMLAHDAERVEHLGDRIWIADEVDHLGHEQVEKFLTHGIALLTMRLAQSLGQRPNSPLIDAEGRLEILSRAVIGHVEGEQIKHRQCVGDQLAILPIKDQLVPVSVTDLQCMNTLV